MAVSLKRRGGSGGLGYDRVKWGRHEKRNSNEALLGEGTIHENQHAVLGEEDAHASSARG